MEGFRIAGTQTGEALPTFGQLEAIGDNLTLQFQARIGLKYYF